MENLCQCKILSQKKLIFQLQALYPNLATSLKYSAPEVIIYKILHLTGIDINQYLGDCSIDCKYCTCHDDPKEVVNNNQVLNTDGLIEEDSERCNECRRLQLCKIETETIEYVDEVEKAEQKLSCILKKLF